MVKASAKLSQTLKQEQNQNRKKIFPASQRPQRQCSVLKRARTTATLSARFLFTRPFPTYVQLHLFRCKRGMGCKKIRNAHVRGRAFSSYFSRVVHLRYSRRSFCYFFLFFFSFSLRVCPSQVACVGCRFIFLGIILRF